MAVGDVRMPDMHPVAGVRIGVVQSHIRYRGRKDLVVFELAPESQCAALFTVNGFAAAPVQISRTHLAQAPTRYWLINTGNANAGTGDMGLANAQASCNALAKLAQVEPTQVLPFSTGVIGEQLPVERLIDHLPEALANLKADNWVDAALGIMTTDTVPKGASERVTIDGVTYTITGISKGAGMIRPNMATMLAFVATDAGVAPELLKTALPQLIGPTFNHITIDGDTSTNDSCALVATHRAGGPLFDDAKDPRFVELMAVMQRVFLRLAQLIVQDGEGATKFITVQVNGGQTNQESCDVAYAIAESPLVKTAAFASDPNWGRLLMAIGKAGVPHLDVSKVQVWLDDVQVCLNGSANPDYREDEGARVMKHSEFCVRVELGRGSASDTVWTCDLSYEYIKINADYRS